MLQRMFGIGLALGLGALIFVFARPGVVEADEGEALELALIDVSDLVKTHRITRGRRIIVHASNYLAPERERIRDKDHPRFAHPEQLVEFLKSTVDPKTWEDLEGADMHHAAGRLRLRNRPETVRKLRNAVAALRAVAGTRYQVQVDVLRQAGGLVNSATLQLADNVEQAVESTRSISYVQDYEVEIAQGSVIANPIVRELTGGLVAEMVATTSLSGDHLIVSGVLEHGDIGPLRTVDTGIDEEYLPRPPRTDVKRSNGEIEIPTLKTSRISFATALPANGTRSLSVFEGGVETTFRLKADRIGGGTVPGLFHLGALTFQPFDARFDWISMVDSMNEGIFHDGPFLHFPDRGSRGSGESADEILESVASNIWYESNEMQGATWGPHRIFLFGKESLRQRARAQLVQAERGRLQGATVGVRVLSVPKDAVQIGPGVEISSEVGRLLASGSIPTLHGRRSGFAAGTYQASLADYDVEVAQEARIADPIVGVGFDGLVVDLHTLYPLGSRDARITLALRYSDRSVEAGGYASGTRYLGPLDKVSNQTREFETSVRVARGGTYVLGAGIDPASKERRLVVELRVSGK